jgi:hypothetical protein
MNGKVTIDKGNVTTIIHAAQFAARQTNFSNVSALWSGRVPRANDLEFVDMEAAERISLQQFPWK